jgi:redox-sensitive bicupin YhaK (pirin superfamily)
MPAVTVPDITLLQRTPVADLLTARPRPVISLSTAPSGFEGEGFPVRRAFMGAPLAAIDPFIMLDQMGEVEYAPGEPKGTPWHPHRGFETVTYIIDGIFDHRDSNGGGGTITNGDTQWMTAGAGIVHGEMFPLLNSDKPNPLRFFQIWLNLPPEKKMADPDFVMHWAEEVGCAGVIG